MRAERSVADSDLDFILVQESTLLIRNAATIFGPLPVSAYRRSRRVYARTIRPATTREGIRGTSGAGRHLDRCNAVQPDLARRWLEQAEENVVDPVRSEDSGRFHLSCFLAQQSAENALKAALLWLRGDWPRIHLIETLTRELAATEPLATRYPDVLDYALRVLRSAVTKHALRSTSPVASRFGSRTCCPPPTSTSRSRWSNRYKLTSNDLTSMCESRAGNLTSVRLYEASLVDEQLAYVDA